MPKRDVIVQHAIMQHLFFGDFCTATHDSGEGDAFRTKVYHLYIKQINKCSKLSRIPLEGGTQIDERASCGKWTFLYKTRIHNFPLRRVKISRGKWTAAWRSSRRASIDHRLLYSLRSPAQSISTFRLFLAGSSWWRRP
jgi:hypothetical protein